MSEPSGIWEGPPGDPADGPAGLVKVVLKGCKVAGFRADLLGGTAKLTLTVALDDQVAVARGWLSWLGNDATPVDIEITEQQMRLPFKDEDEGGFMMAEPVGLAGGTPTLAEAIGLDETSDTEGVADD